MLLKSWSRPSKSLLCGPGFARSAVIVTSPQPLPVAREAGRQLGFAGLAGSRLAEHDDIESREIMPFMAKAFTTDAAHTVARYGQRELFLRQRKTNAGILFARFVIQHREIAVARATCVTKDGLKLTGCGQSTKAWEIETTEHRHTIRRSKIQCDKRARFLRRLRFKTRRPPLVAIRARKPWVRARLMRLG